MRTFAFASLFLAVSAILDAPELSAMNCGGCYHIDSSGYRRCAVGNDDTKFPYSTIQPDGKDLNDIPELVQANGLSSATFMPIAEMRTSITTAGSSWDLMFCSSYLDQYKDGAVVDGVYSDPGTGAACVSSATADAILAADNMARTRYNDFGTTNGYASSWAVSKGDSYPVDMQRWGTGGTGDVPSNWCGTYMKYMLCSVAFPQVTLTTAERNTAAAAAAAAGTVPDTTGKIRPVELSSCETLFRSCNRREPWEDETKADFVHPSLNNVRALATDGQDEIEQALVNDAFCLMWGRGYDLAMGGPATADEDENVVIFEASSTTTFSALLLLVAVIFQVAL